MKKGIGVECGANGKINLFLDIVCRTGDGYHQIESVMQSVSLCDRVTLAVVPSSAREVLLDCNLPYIPRDSRNVAVKAAELYMRESGVFGKVKITLTKRIPVAGGMAGGSADAAAVLLMMNRQFGSPLGNAKLLELAAKLGSDVPFCLHGGTALCCGRGELISPLENRVQLKLLIVSGIEHVSTPWAYGELDSAFGNFEEYTPKRDKLESLKIALAGGDIDGVLANMYNIFEEVILPQRPAARRAKELLIENGAAAAMMSGSGATVFGVFKNDEQRTLAEEKLTALGYKCKSAETAQ